MSVSAKSPISFSVKVARLPKKGMPVSFDAEPEQRAALARDHALLEVKKLHADLVVLPWKRDGVSVSGRVEGDIIQECVVTLEPIEAHIDEAVSAVFVPEESKLDRFEEQSGGEVILDPEGPDGPESLSGNSVDVGALAEQFFALGINPYPRKDGVAGFISRDVEEDDRPFGSLGEKLSALKPKG